MDASLAVGLILLIVALLVGLGLIRIALPLLRRPWHSLTILAVFVLIAAVTNPDHRAHTGKLKALAMRDADQEERLRSVFSGDNLEFAGAAIGYSLGSSLFDQWLDTIVSTDNYVFFSISHVHSGSDSAVFAVGALGNVLVVNDRVKRGLRR